MFKTQQIKIYIGTLLLIFTALGAGCSMEKTTAQTPPVKTAESTKSEYKPPKRVSRDVIKSETKNEAPTIKIKK